MHTVEFYHPLARYAHNWGWVVLINSALCPRLSFFPTKPAGFCWFQRKKHDWLLACSDAPVVLSVTLSVVIFLLTQSQPAEFTFSQNTFFFPPNTTYFSKHIFYNNDHDEVYLCSLRLVRVCFGLHASLSTWYVDTPLLSDLRSLSTDAFVAACTSINKIYLCLIIWVFYYLLNCLSIVDSPCLLLSRQRLTFALLPWKLPVLLWPSWLDSFLLSLLRVLLWPVREPTKSSELTILVSGVLSSLVTCSSSVFTSLNTEVSTRPKISSAKLITVHSTVGTRSQLSN